jgi:predicted ABC-type transport system involved in lysophospholipase L1 biosynthesis ATPase subunit
MTAIECIGVTKLFPSPSGGDALTVLRDVSFSVDRGESVAVLGPSGAGKSTLLAVIGTLEPPTTGSVLLDGKPVTGLTPRSLAALRNRRIGFVFQSHLLLPQLTLLENVLVPAMAAAGGARGARDGAVRLLERVGLGGRLRHTPAALSGGECQRAAFVRALVNSPSLVLADEPTGSLDSATADSLSRLMVELNRETGVTLVVVTHSDSLASRMSRTIRIADGEIRREGQ